MPLLYAVALARLDRFSYIQKRLSDFDRPLVTFTVEEHRTPVRSNNTICYVDMKTNRVFYLLVFGADSPGDNICYPLW